MLLFDYDSTYDPSAPVIEVSVRYRGEATITAMIDSGADATILPYHVLQTVNARYFETRILRGTDGARVSVNRYLVHLQIGNFQIHSIRAIASDAAGEPLIGRDVLNQLVVTLDGPGSAVMIR